MRIEVSEPTWLDDRWCCTGKILGPAYGHLPWLGSGERPEDHDEDAPSATLYLVSGVGKTPEEARKRVMAKIRNVWGTDSQPPPGPHIQDVDTIRGVGAPESSRESFLSRMARFLRRRSG